VMFSCPLDFPLWVGGIGHRLPDFRRPASPEGSGGWFEGTAILRTSVCALAMATIC
jgi:hypothetical protein